MGVAVAALDFVTVFLLSKTFFKIPRTFTVAGVSAEPLNGSIAWFIIEEYGLALGIEVAVFATCEADVDSNVFDLYHIDLAVIVEDVANGIKQYGAATSPEGFSFLYRDLAFDPREVLDCFDGSEFGQKPDSAVKVIEQDIVDYYSIVAVSDQGNKANAVYRYLFAWRFFVE